MNAIERFMAMHDMAELVNGERFRRADCQLEAFESYDAAAEACERYKAVLRELEVTEAFGCYVAKVPGVGHAVYLGRHSVQRTAPTHRRGRNIFGPLQVRNTPRASALT